MTLEESPAAPRREPGAALALSSSSPLVWDQHARPGQVLSGHALCRGPWESLMQKLPCFDLDTDWRFAVQVACVVCIPTTMVSSVGCSVNMLSICPPVKCTDSMPSGSMLCNRITTADGPARIQGSVWSSEETIERRLRRNAIDLLQSHLRSITID